MDQQPNTGPKPDVDATAKEFNDLLRDAQAGSERAVGDLLSNCRNYLLMIANREMGNQYQSKVGASDAVQSTLFHAQQNIEQFRGGTKEELLAWLRNILRNNIRTTHRRYSADKRDVAREGDGSASKLIDDQTTPTSNAILADEAVQLRAALQALPEDQRTVIVLRNWEQLPFQEIGERMNRSSEAARKLWARAITALKKAMNDGE